MYDSERRASVKRAITALTAQGNNFVELYHQRRRVERSGAGESLINVNKQFRERAVIHHRHVELAAVILDDLGLVVPEGILPATHFAESAAGMPALLLT